MLRQAGMNIFIRILNLQTPGVFLTFLKPNCERYSETTLTAAIKGALKNNGERKQTPLIHKEVSFLSLLYLINTHTHTQTNTSKKLKMN